MKTKIENTYVINVYSLKRPNAIPVLYVRSIVKKLSIITCSCMLLIRIRYFVVKSNEAKITAKRDGSIYLLRFN